MLGRLSLALVGALIWSSCSGKVAQRSGSSGTDASAESSSENGAGSGDAADAHAGCQAEAGMCPQPQCTAVFGQQIVGDCRVAQGELLLCFEPSGELTSTVGVVGCAKRSSDGAVFYLASATFADWLADAGSDWTPCTPDELAGVGATPACP